MPQTFRSMVLEDLRWYGPPTPAQLVKSLYRDRTFRPVLTLRLAQHSPAPLQRLANLAHRWACSRAGVDLPTSARIAAGFKLTHGWGAVVSGSSVIDEDVIVMQGVTLGARAGGRGPRVGRGVFLGPNACVIGDVAVGEGATVSAGCVIVEDVPPHTLVTLDRSCLTQRPHVRAEEKDRSPLRR